MFSQKGQQGGLWPSHLVINSLRKRQNPTRMTSGPSDQLVFVTSGLRTELRNVAWCYASASAIVKLIYTKGYFATKRGQNSCKFDLKTLTTDFFVFSEDLPSSGYGLQCRRITWSCLAPRTKILLLWIFRLKMWLCRTDKCARTILEDGCWSGRITSKVIRSDGLSSPTDFYPITGIEV